MENTDNDSLFSLKIEKQDNRQVIIFTNNSSEFVEVIFTIDGRETKEGKVYNGRQADKVKGYAYPPKLKKAVKKDKKGRPLIFNPAGGEVKAYIFAGQGSYLEEDLEKPTFLRHKLVSKIKFKRSGNEPICVLAAEY